MEALDPSAASCFMVDVDDDLLNFSLEDETVFDDDEKTTKSITKHKHPLSSSYSSSLDSSNPVLSLLPSQQHPVSLNTNFIFTVFFFSSLLFWP